MLHSLGELEQMTKGNDAMQVRIAGVPYAQSKTRGRKDGCSDWTAAVIAQTAHLPPVSGPCRLSVTFFLPPDKYPLDHPYGMDLDNLLKRFFDALQQTVFRDVAGKDGCVTEIEARKVKVESYELAGAQLEIQPEPGQPVKFFHGTSPDAAVSILASGFRDATGKYMTDSLHTGVWISDRPLGEQGGETFLEITVAPEILTQLEEYEWVTEGSTYREWLVPASILNEHGSIRLRQQD